MNIGAALTRKIGPLPAWGWGVALGGAIVAARMLRGGGSSGDAATPTIITVPTGGAVGMGEDFASDLANQLDQLRGDNEDRFEEISDDWSDRFDDLMDAVDTIQTPIANTPGNGSIQPVTPKSGWSLPAGMDLGTVIIGLRTRYPKWYQEYMRQPFAAVQTAGESSAERAARLRKEMDYYTSRIGK